MHFREWAEGESGVVVEVNTTVLILRGGQVIEAIGSVRLKWWDHEKSQWGTINEWSIEEWRRRVEVTR